MTLPPPPQPPPRRRTFSSPLLPSLPARIRELPTPLPQSERAAARSTRDAETSSVTDQRGAALAENVRVVLSRAQEKGVCPVICFAIEKMVKELACLSGDALYTRTIDHMALLERANGLGFWGKQTKREVLSLFDHSLQSTKKR